MWTLSDVEALSGLTREALRRSLAVVITLLAVEQLAASVLIAPKGNSSDHAMLGVELYLGGIGLQGLVMITTLALAIALRKKLTDRANKSSRPVTILVSLTFSLVFLLVRTTYRLFELSAFFTGHLQFLAHSEVYFYAFECLPVLIALGIWLFVEVDELSAYPPDDNHTYHELHVEPESDCTSRHIDVEDMEV